MNSQNPQVIGGVDILRATGLIARGYSKLTLQPTNITGGIKDLVDGIAALGIRVPQDVGVFVPADAD